MDVDTEMLAHLLQGLYAEGHQVDVPRVLQGVLDRARGKPAATPYNADDPVSAAYWLGYDFH